MIKRVFQILTSLAAAGFVLLASGIVAKAALPCTYDIINDANANIAAAQAAYDAAKADEAAKLAVFNAVKADNLHSQLAYEQAAADYMNAVNKSAWCLSMVNNYKSYLKNIKGREGFEDKFASNRVALADLTNLQASKYAADGSANIANGTADIIANIEKAIKGYEQQLATSPSVQAQIDELNKKLEYYRADYAAKAQTAGENAAAFANNINVPGLYKTYSLGFENFQWNMELNRDNTDWDPKGYY